jgi:hypothetical protein
VIIWCVEFIFLSELWGTCSIVTGSGQNSRLLVWHFVWHLLGSFYYLEKLLDISTLHEVGLLSFLVELAGWMDLGLHSSISHVMYSGDTLQVGVCLPQYKWNERSEDLGLTLSLQGQ